MTCKVLDTIRKHHMLNDVSSLCVGVSGGADSVALLHILLRLQSRFGFSIKAVHVNHHLRGEESDRDAAFVKDLCESLEVPCVIADFNVAQIARSNKQSVELCGRELRYRVFRAQNCDAIAVAHTRSDSIETALFHLARGTSLKGACGIPPKNGNVIRPLIACTRSEVEAYIGENHLPFITDSSNLTDDYARNFIRHQIVVPFGERFPAFETCFSRFMENAELVQDFLEKSADELRKSAAANNGFSLMLLQNAHPAVLQCFLRNLLSENMKKPTEEAHILLCQKAVQTGAGKVQIAEDAFFEVRSGKAFFSQKSKCESNWSVPVSAAGAELKTPNGSYQMRLCTGEERLQTDRRHWIDPQKIRFPLVLRTRQAGDIFHSPIRKQSKTLKKLFNEMKLPPAARDSVAVLSCGNGENSVVWVETVGADAAFQAETTTDPVWIIRKERNAHSHD